MTNLITKIHAVDIKSLRDLLNGVNATDPRNQDWNTITGAIENTVTAVIDLSIVIAVIMVVYGGILYMTALGKDDKIETAKKTLTWSIVGFVLVLLAKIIISIINSEL